MKRSIATIAADIDRNWKNVNYAARPYLDAMYHLRDINDNYYYDTGRSIVIYFLGNARAFRGEDAKRLKAELKELSK